MGIWQIFRPHRWARRADAEKSVRFREVVAAIQSALRDQSGSQRTGRLAGAPAALNLPEKSGAGGAHAPDT